GSVDHYKPDKNFTLKTSLLIGTLAHRTKRQKAETYRRPNKNSSSISAPQQKSSPQEAAKQHCSRKN
ncbi:hypothetical protein ACEP35_27120, partial [Pseudomonas aeruginosa]